MYATKFNIAALTTRMFSPYLTCSTRIAAFTTAVFPQTALITSKITVNDSFSASKVGTYPKFVRATASDRRRNHMWRGMT